MYTEVSVERTLSQTKTGRFLVNRCPAMNVQYVSTVVFN